MVLSRRAHRAALVTWLILGGVAVASAAHFFVGKISEAGIDLESRTLLFMASTAAASIEADDVAMLRGSEHDVSALSVQNIRAALKRFRNVFSSVGHIYLVIQEDGEIYSLADAMGESVPERPWPAQISREATAVLRRVFATGEGAFEGPRHDLWGDWVSGFAPIVNHANQVVAVVGFDVPAAHWESAVGRYRLLGEILMTAVIALIVLFVFVIILQNRYHRRIWRLNVKLETELAELSLANRIVENSSTVIFRFRAEQSPMTLTYISRNIERYGYRPEALMLNPHAWLELFHQDDRPVMMEEVANIQDGKTRTARRELRFKKLDGSWAWFSGEISGVRDAGNRLVAFEGILFDITQSKQDQDKIAHMASHDPLTGLTNRAAFIEQLQTAISQAKAGGKGFAVLYLDIDHFKDLNDAFGHEQGDLLLLAIAERLRKSLREKDLVGRFSIARLGGDEFAILQMNVCEPSDAAALAQRLNQLLAETLYINDTAIHATVSIGISLYNPQIEQPSDLLTKADLALYRAKGAGRNQFCFHSSDLDVEVRERVAMGEDLRSALKNRELELYYQPQVDGATGRIIGLEALMRWNHGNRGPVPPDTFIHIAERTGLITDLGQWAIEETCVQIRRWLAEGVDTPIVGVNVSALQLRNAVDLLRVLREAMRRSNIGADRLELELTETVLGEATESRSDVLQQFRNLGVRIAIDDFGTGYSSLQYLHAYPISRIKIAQQFTRKLPDDAGDAAIVQATISLARALRVDVIAEGVETAEQLAFLMAHGCRNIQGFYFSPPVSAEQVTGLLKKGSFDLLREGSSRGTSAPVPNKSTGTSASGRSPIRSAS